MLVGKEKAEFNKALKNASDLDKVFHDKALQLINMSKLALEEAQQYLDNISDPVIVQGLCDAIDDI